jgi:2-keto-3-deoxy-L-rhamnonate aldolase RhmA
MVIEAPSRQGDGNGHFRERDEKEAAGGRYRPGLWPASSARCHDWHAGRGGRADWLFVDTEHGAFSLDDVAQICVAALPTGVTPIVRVCAGALHEGTRALDNGAQGIIVPHVDTVEQAGLIAQSFRYPPVGSRSWGGPPALFGYSPPDSAEAQAAINREILVIAMIESTEAVANSTAIAGVDGIDGLLIGTSDLTAEMGISGQIRHPRVEEAYRTVGEACRKADKFLGMGGVYELDAIPRYVELGARFVLTGSDHAYILAGANLRSAFFRKLVGERK